MNSVLDVRRSQQDEYQHLLVTWSVKKRIETELEVKLHPCIYSKLHTQRQREFNLIHIISALMLFGMQNQSVCEKRHRKYYMMFKMNWPLGLKEECYVINTVKRSVASYFQSCGIKSTRHSPSCRWQKTPGIIRFHSGRTFRRTKSIRRLQNIESMQVIL